MDLTSTERKIILKLRELLPFERLDISKDKGGKEDTYFVRRIPPEEKSVFSPEN